jgi:hypothetical protein
MYMHILEGHDMRCTYAQICTTRAIVYWARACVHMIESPHIYIQMLIGGRLSFIHSLFLSVYSTWLPLIVYNCRYSSSHMSYSHLQQVLFMLSTTVNNLLWFFFVSYHFTTLAAPKINQKIVIGPNDINAYPGETIQFPCIVSKQSDAIVTWCWNDFCTLGKTQLLRHETTYDGLISIYQYTAYPRFQLSINERLST